MAAADPSSFDYFQAGELPMLPPTHLDTGGMDYWQAGEQPPMYSSATSEEPAARIPRAPAAIDSMFVY